MLWEVKSKKEDVRVLSSYLFDNINIFNNLKNFTNNQLQQINKVYYAFDFDNNSNIRQIQQKKTIITCEFEEEKKRT